MRKTIPASVAHGFRKYLEENPNNGNQSDPEIFVLDMSRYCSPNGLASGLHMAMADMQAAMSRGATIITPMETSA